MEPARILLTVALALLSTTSALSQSESAATTAATPPAATNASKAFTATITGDNVFVRSGPSVHSTYPFGRLMMGDVVEVDEESFGWAKIRTGGAAFADKYGYVVANEKVTLSPDGKSISVTGTTQVLAPNIDADGNPDASTRSIGELHAGETIAVVGQMQGDREKVHKIKLPANATGWVNMNFLRRATKGEANAHVTASQESTAPSVPAIEGGTTVAAQGTSPATTSETVTLDSSTNSKGNDATPPSGSSEVVEVVAPEPPQPPAKTAEQNASEARRATHRDLEAIWVKVKAEPLGSSELVTLKTQYVILSADPMCETDIRGMCAARIQQLEIQIDAQARIQELKALRSSVDVDSDQLKALRIAMEARSDYTVVGVLNASTVYDGNRLPLLFRLTDPAAGQTVAYIAAKDANAMSTMLGTLVGIRGTKRFDEALKVNIVDPGTIDILTIRKEPQAQ